MLWITGDRMVRQQLVRVYNTDLPGEKRILFALRRVKGVSLSLANAILYKAGVPKLKHAGDLTDEEIERIESVMKNLPEHVPAWLLNRRKDYATGKDLHVYAADLDFTIQQDKRRLARIKSYRGLRLQAGLPVRGQRTKSNFRKNKGKTMGVRKKK